MSDLERVLDVLLHDLRSPLGVAGGYLRLLRDQRLPSPEEAERAIVKTQDALRRMSALCAEAGAWLEPAPPAPGPAVAAGDVVAGVAALMETPGLAVGPAAGALAGRVVRVPDLDRIAGAVAALLTAVAQPLGGRCAVHVDGDVLRFAVTGTSRPARETAEVLDPWAYPGLATALACRTIAGAAGRCDGGRAAGEALRVAFDLEAAAGSS
ncbi:MAG: hypothetical protein R2708_28270 [Vicinamibacterales bacterium]